LAIPQPASGAPSLSANTLAYVQNTLGDYISIAGSPITYSIRSQTGTDEYGHPQFTYTNQSITALISIITDQDFPLLQAGFKPPHDMKFWVRITDIASPKLGDRITDPANIEWEIRGYFPRYVGATIIFYELIGRRVISSASITGQ
jgi:hypothetical protein